MPGFEYIDYLEKEAVSEVFEEGGILFAHGFDSIRTHFHVREFEQQIASDLNCKFAACCSSGTAAIKTALKAAGVKPGDTVITQPFNFVATAEAIADCNANIIYSDMTENLFMDPTSLEALIDEKCKAIIIVHMLGQGDFMEEIKEIAHRKGIVLIEDNCESLGANLRGQQLGTIGDIGVLSFDFGKTITCGEGGAILTNEQKYYDYCFSYIDHGHAFVKGLSRGNDMATMPGFNYRMGELQGAVGKVQLDKLTTINQDSKERYLSLQKGIGTTHYERVCSKADYEQSYDTYILKDLSTSKKKRVLETLKEFEISTKNIPDAMRWHCAYYWDHIEKNPANDAFKAKCRYQLDNSVAIPIMKKYSRDFYYNLGTSLKETL